MMMAWEEDANKHIVLADVAGLGVKNIDPDLAFAQVVDLVDDRLKRTLHVGFQDQVQFLRLTSFDLGEQFLQGDLLGSGGLLLVGCLVVPG